MVDLGGEGYEVPMHGERSVMQPSPRTMHSQPMQSQPMDGEIIYESEPSMDGSYGGYEGGYEGGYQGDYQGDYGCDSMGCDSGSCNGSCGGSCAGAWRPCMTLCFPQDGWASFEYLYWVQRGMDLPPLVTRSDSGTARGDAGVLGLSTTDILFGGDDVLDDGFFGGRLQFGFWLDKCHTWGIGAEYFELGEESDGFRGNSSGDPILARPFFNILTGEEDAELVAFPNVLTGEVNARATSHLVGAGVNLRHLTNCSSGCGPCGQYQSRSHLLFGYRYLQLEESVSVTEDLVGLPPDPGAFQIQDRFRTRNQFNGFDMGMMYNRRHGLFSLDLLAKLAVGNTHQTVDIRGTTRVDGGAAQTGGLLAQTSNIGNYERDRFTILPELGITGGYYLTPNFKLTAGYTMIFWSNVVRPGDQIDTDINPNFLPPPAVPFTGAARPRFSFVDTDYYVHGGSFGAQFTW